MLDLQRSLTIGLVGFLVLLILNAIIAAAHSALINTRKQTLRDKAEAGDRRARSALRMAEEASILLESRQLMSVLIHFFSIGLLTIFFARPLTALAVANGGNDAIVPVLIYTVTWFIGGLFMLTLGELLPDIMASAKPESTAILFDPVMRPLFVITSPIARMLTRTSTAVAKIFVGTRDMSYVTEEEIKTLVDAGSEEGVIEDDAKEMIYSIFQFGDKVVSEVMTPRPDVQGMEARATVVSAMDFVLETGHSRIPVYHETIDHIVGILYAKDIFRTFRSGGSQVAPIKDFVRPAYFIPASKKAGSLMEELQQRKIHMAIVIDEYGGMAGLITFEDLLEEIVGEIQDEYDPLEEAAFEQVSESEYLFDAGIALADVNNMLDVALPTDESDTLGGYVFAVLGKIPLAGETFTTNDLEFRVEIIVGRRVRKVYVKKLPIVTPEMEAERERERERDAREQREIDRNSDRDAERRADRESATARDTRETRVLTQTEPDSLGSIPQPASGLPLTPPPVMPLPTATAVPTFDLNTSPPEVPHEPQSETSTEAQLEALPEGLPEALPANSADNIPLDMLTRPTKIAVSSKPDLSDLPHALDAVSVPPPIDFVVDDQSSLPMLDQAPSEMSSVMSSDMQDDMQPDGDRPVEAVTENVSVAAAVSDTAPSEVPIDTPVDTSIDSPIDTPAGHAEEQKP